MTLDGQHLGKYRLISLLGRGGMAEVYLAEHELLQAKVAVKILPPEYARDQGMVDRFMREARAAARLNHPHIIRIHDVGSERGLNYFAMDYLEGSPLSKLIPKGGGMELQRIRQISQQVLSALAEAHQAGIVHRDIKPDNVIINQRGSAVVTDFGIAKAASDAHLTSTGAFVGTPRYASPEQVQGREVDGRSDLYSWGLVMFEMATGRPPFPGPDTAAFVYQQVHEVPPAPHDLVPDLPPGLSALILKALEKDPAERFATAAEMLTALERALPSPAGGQAPAGPGPQARARALLKQAQAYLQQGQWRGGQELAAKAKDLDPTLAEAAQVLAQAQAELDRDERINNLTVEAEACLDDGLYEQAAGLISDLLGVSRDKQRTMAWLEEVLELQKQAQVVQGELKKGQALEKAGDQAAALEHYRRLAQTYPEAPSLAQAVTRLENHLAVEELSAQAQEATAQGDLRAAQDLYMQALRLEPGNQALKAGLQQVHSRMSKGQRAQALLAQGRLLKDSDDLAGAESALTEAVGLDPTVLEASTLLEQVRQQARSQGGQTGPSLGTQPGPTVAMPPASGPTVFDSSLAQATVAQTPAKPASARLGLWVGLGGAVLAGLGLALWLGLKSPSPTPAPPVAPTPAAQPAVPPAPDPAAQAQAGRQRQAQEELARQRAEAERQAQEELTRQRAEAERQAQAQLEAIRQRAEAERKALAEATRQRAEAERQAQDEARARQEMEGKVQALLDRGEARAAGGHFEEAAKLWREALALKPGLAAAQKKLAGLEERRRDWSREQSEQQAKKGSQIALTRGIDAFNAGNYDEAVKQLTIYTQAYPSDSQAQNYLAQAQKMHKGQSQGELVVQCTPEAEVWLDGKPVGKTPLRLPTAIGDHKVEVRSFGGVAGQPVEIKGRATTTIRFQLLGGSLAVNSTPWANVSLDGKPMGQTPLSLDNLPLGPHRVRATREGFQDSEQDATLHHGQKNRVNFRLEPAR